MLRGIIGKMLLALGGAVLLHQTALAQEGAPAAGCANGACNACNTCPSNRNLPLLRWGQDGTSFLKIHQGCPKPICSPCDMQNWGYYQTCWTPWPFPPDYSHCRMPCAAESVQPMPPAAAATPPARGTPMPVARKSGS